MPPHFVRNVQQPARQPPSESEVDAAFRNAAKIYKDYILKAASPRVSRDYANATFAIQGRAAIDNFQAAHGEHFQLISGALRLMLDDAISAKQ